jgi:hypothetical protein
MYKRYVSVLDGFPRASETEYVISPEKRRSSIPESIEYPARSTLANAGLETLDQSLNYNNVRMDPFPPITPLDPDKI